MLWLPNSRWVKIALLDHLTGSWASPYIQYISRLRSKVSLYDPPPTLHYLRQHLFKWSFFETNRSLSNSSSLMGIAALDSFKKADYLCPSRYLTVIASFKLKNAGLGNKCPLTGNLRFSTCPRCEVSEPLCEEHLLFVCSSIQQKRKETGLETLKTQYTLRGFSISKMYSLFVNGLDILGHPISLKDYLERGSTMSAMRAAWLDAQL